MFTIKKLQNLRICLPFLSYTEQFGRSLGIKISSPPPSPQKIPFTRNRMQGSACVCTVFNLREMDKFLINISASCKILVEELK